MDAFISAVDLEAVLGAEVDETALITKIALDSACTAVRSYLDQDVNYVEDDVEIRDGTGRRRMRLRQRPVREVTQVLVDGTEVTTYSVRGSKITLPEGEYFWHGLDNVAITYSHGWDIEESSVGERVPADIRLVALLVAKRIYKTVGSTSIGIVKQSEQIGDYAYTLGELPEDVQQKIAASGTLLLAEEAVLDRYAVRLVV